MAKEIIGEIDCPHCGAVASVHQNGKAAALLYYRCGEVVRGFSTGCGTVQIYGRSGQEYIKTRMRAKGGDPVQPAVEPVAIHAPEPAPTPQPDPVPPRKKTIFQQMTEGLTNL